MLRLIARVEKKSLARVQKIAEPIGGKGTMQPGPRRWEQHTTRYACAFQASQAQRTGQIRQGVEAGELVGDSMIC